MEGDAFSLGLADPVDKTDPGFGLEFALGISFGSQPSGQVSLIDVKGQRLSSSAGGQDDGLRANGALITVGGIGDDPGNPADPFAGASDTSTDDERYTLDPFVNDGGTDILVETVNPSNDDNIFFASLSLGATVAIVGEGILLTPIEAPNPVNTDHTVTARLQDDDEDAIFGRTVTLEDVSGPNSGLTASATTDATGAAAFAWSSSAAGTDVVEARFGDSRGLPRTARAQKTWESTGGMTRPVCAAVE